MATLYTIASEYIQGLNEKPVLPVGLLEELDAIVVRLPMDYKHPSGWNMGGWYGLLDGKGNVACAERTLAKLLSAWVKL